MKRSVLVLLVVALFAVAGCNSKSPAPTSPSGPSSAPSASVPIDLSATTSAGVDSVTSGTGIVRPVVGVVEKLEGTCPSRSFMLAGIRVLVSAQTRYESGTCADLVEGIRVGAIGAKQDDRTVAAARVKIAPALPPLPKPVAGEVTSVSGTCPALTFVVAGVTVRTTEGTDFDGGECADVKAGIRAGVAGPRDSAGVLIAEHVKIPPPLTTVQGIVSALGGTCPRVSFALLEPGSRSGVTVVTGDKTRFEGGGCADLREGLHAGAVGLINGRGVLEARGVKIATGRD